MTGVPALWLDDGDVRLFHGDCLDVLRSLPDGSVHMCATSPPFYGLRDYGVEGQIGLEESPDEWVARLVAVFREVRRVLRDDGTLWVEIGDSYSSGNREGHGTRVGYKQATNLGTIGHDYRPPMPDGIKQKDMLGQPWMLAFALRADGWYLRSEIIWHRPNPMPESVTDRPTKAHSTVFLLSKQPRYFYDADAIRTPYAYDGRAMTAIPDNGIGGSHENHAGRKGRERWPGIGKAQAQAQARRDVGAGGHDESEPMDVHPMGANARSVWTIPTEPTPFAHFATWPQALVRRMIQAGTSERGCCPECGAPWRRQIERSDPPEHATPGHTPSFQTRRFASATPGYTTTTTTTGWSPSCECVNGDPESVVAFYPPVPCVVLDPFAGSGTTLKVARDHGRHAVGIELNEDYCRIAADRLAQQSLLTGDAA